MADRMEARDRQDVPIWNAIEAKDFKQALKLVEKRIAKKADEYFLVSLHSHLIISSFTTRLVAFSHRQLSEDVFDVCFLLQPLP
jgi:hypothetical protein